MTSGLRLSQYVIRRLVQIPPVLFVVVCLVFVFCRLAPGDPVYYLGGATITEEYYDRVKAELGLDKPMPVQFLIYMGNVLRGDLGRSTVYQAPVTAVVVERLLNTLLLVLSSVVVASLVGILLGVLAARSHNRLADNIISIFSLVGYSQPLFWTAMVLIIFFLGSGLPIQGMTTVGEDLSGLAHLVDVLKHLFLPALTLCIYQVALFTRLTRTSMLEVLHLDFISTARSKGVREWGVLIRHALRNALIPIITLMAVQIGTMFSGAALVEVVFSWPGVGSLILEAVLARDYPLLSGVFIFVSLAVILANLAADVIYAKLDPRIAY